MKGCFLTRNLRKSRKGEPKKPPDAKKQKEGKRMQPHRFGGKMAECLYQLAKGTLDSKRESITRILKGVEGKSQEGEEFRIKAQKTNQFEEEKGLCVGSLRKKHGNLSLKSISRQRPLRREDTGNNEEK